MEFPDRERQMELKKIRYNLEIQDAERQLIEDERLYIGD